MNLSPVTADSIVITLLYTSLLLWGAWVGVRQVFQSLRRPDELLNPLFCNRQAIPTSEVTLVVEIRTKTRSCHLSRELSVQSANCRLSLHRVKVAC